MRLFISKDIKSIGQLSRYAAEHKIDLIAHSFLSFNAIPFNIEKEYDIIFFNSPRAVDYFLLQETILPGTKIACIGTSTKLQLVNRGYKVDFTGESSDPLIIAKEFADWVGDDIVLVPHSTISKHSVLTYLDSEQVVSVPVYETQISSKEIEPCDIYIFSSPSNAEGFLCSNILQPSSTIIAYGTSTQDYLKEHGIVSIVPDRSTLESIIELLSNLSQA